MHSGVDRRESDLATIRSRRGYQTYRPHLCTCHAPPSPRPCPNSLQTDTSPRFHVNEHTSQLAPYHAAVAVRGIHGQAHHIAEVRAEAKSVPRLLRRAQILYLYAPWVLESRLEILINDRLVVGWVGAIVSRSHDLRAGREPVHARPPGRRSLQRPRPPSMPCASCCPFSTLEPSMDRTQRAFVVSIANRAGCWSRSNRRRVSKARSRNQVLSMTISDQPPRRNAWLGKSSHCDIIALNLTHET